MSNPSIPAEYQRIALAARPVGAPKAGDFRLESIPTPRPGPGQFLVRVGFLSLDPYQRGRMNDGPSYAAPVPLGGTMTGRTVGRIVESHHPGFPAGAVVFNEGIGWAQWGVSDGTDNARLIDPALAPVSTGLGVLGIPGLTAWVGLIEIGNPRPGETVVVSAATGAVGSLACQLARMAGARVIGIAGGPEKCAWARDAIGVDLAIDHRAGDLATALAAACPDGIDVYFENVGGKVIQAVLPLLNVGARMPICGAIAHYNQDGPGADGAFAGPDMLGRLWMTFITRRVMAKGFVVGDHRALLPKFLATIGPLVRAGTIRHREDVVDGIQAAIPAFQGLLEGRNFGKLLVRIGADPAVA